MINKISKLRQAWKDTAKAVGREQIMCDLTKVVLINDFMECFNVGATADKPTELKQMQMRYADHQETVPRLTVRFGPMPQVGNDAHEVYDQIMVHLQSGPYSQFETLMARRGLPVAIIPAFALSMKAKARCAEPLAGPRQVLAEAEQAIESHGSMANFIALQRADAVLQAYEMAYPQEEMAAQLAPLFMIVNDAPRLGHFFSRAHMKSVVKGEEKVITDFWSAVNELEDYTDILPRLPRPRPPSPSNGEFGSPILRPSMGNA